MVGFVAAPIVEEDINGELEAVIDAVADVGGGDSDSAAWA